tara:strand:- start:440 stop:1396 length:957 start_codon:yes stop_codon:yes gene_type:complete
MRINICQVSLNRDIPLIIENFKNFKKFYQNINFFIICPNAQIEEFENKLNFDEIKIISEDEVLEFKKFEFIYENLNKEIQYKEQFNKRLKWYYQQVLKITFAFNFISEKSENIVIWDADTIILRKISFFKKDYSLKYGNFFESHKAYYHTNEYILKKLPKYFISSLNQFIAISKYEYTFFKDNFLKEKFISISLGEKVTELIFKGIFNKHKIYNGSLFSEYELIGQSNNLFKKEKQKPILFLRFGLDGMLSVGQKFLAIFLGYIHVTYEHSHPNKKSFGMLNRTQTWKGFIIILLKNFFKFYLRYFKHILMYNFYKNK